MVKHDPNQSTMLLWCSGVITGNEDAIIVVGIVSSLWKVLVYPTKHSSHKPQNDFKSIKKKVCVR